jgi:triacylglycerol lipase
VLALFLESTGRAIATVSGSRITECATSLREGVRTASVEAACMTAVVALYPLGLLPRRGRDDSRGVFRTDELSWRQRAPWITDPDTVSAPVLLLHGVLSNRSIFTLLAGALRRQNHSEVHALNHSPVTTATGDVRIAARQLAKQVDRLRERTGRHRINIVGHSLGGLVARYYVQCLGGDEAVDTLVTLGTPHHGTRVAQLAPLTRLARQLRPGSGLITELSGPAPGCRTRFVAVWSRQDQVVVPQHSARLEHPDLQIETTEMPDVGHLSLPVNPRVIRAVTIALARPAAADRPAVLAPVAALASAAS